MRRSLLVLAVGFAAGCSLVARLDDSAYGANDADAGLDGETADARSANGGSEPDGGVSCVGTDPGFCDDFERTSILGAWTSSTATGGATLGVVDGGAHGGVAQITGCAVGTVCSAALVKHFDATANHVRYGFDVDVVHAPLGTVSFFGLTLSLADGRTPQLFFLLDASAVSLGHQVNMPDGSDAHYADVPLRRPFPDGQWGRVVVDVTLGSTPGATVSLDGEVVATTDLPAAFVPAPFVLMAGNFYSAGATDMSILFDNVLVEAMP